MGEQSPISDWKLSFGTIDQIRSFEKEGQSYLHKFSELFYWCHKLSHVVKKGHNTDVLVKNLAKINRDCRNIMHFYLFSAVFFMDIDAHITLEHLNRIRDVITEMTETDQAIGNGLTQIFLAFTFKVLGQDSSRNRAVQSAVEIFPPSSRFAGLTQKQLQQETSLTEWITMGMKYYNIPEKNLFPLIQEKAEKIDEKDFQDDFRSDLNDISVEDYEKKFLEHYTKQKKMKLHVRRCSKCTYFMTSEDITEKRCPRCNAPMNFALYCSTCGIWYTVKTHRKYVCPTCGIFLEKKERIE